MVCLYRPLSQNACLLSGSGAPSTGQIYLLLSEKGKGWSQSDILASDVKKKKILRLKILICWRYNIRGSGS